MSDFKIGDSVRILTEGRNGIPYVDGVVVDLDIDYDYDLLYSVSVKTTSNEVFDVTPSILLNISHLKSGVEEWLRERWRRDNLSKYRNYFEDWFTNLTSNQIIGFHKQMTTKLY